MHAATMRPSEYLCIAALDLHRHALSCLGCVHRLVVQLHGGDPPQLDAILGGHTDGTAHLGNALHDLQEERCEA